MYTVYMYMMYISIVYGTVEFSEILHLARWWFEIFFIFTPNPGEMIHFDFCIFFKRVGWNHQLAGMFKQNLVNNGDFNYPPQATLVSEWFFFPRGDSRCSTTTWRVKVLHVKDLQWFVTKTLAAKRDKMWMWWGASAEKSKIKKTLRQKEIGGEITDMCVFLVLFLKKVLFSRWCWNFVGILLKIFFVEDCWLAKSPQVHGYGKYLVFAVFYSSHLVNRILSTAGRSVTGKVI